MPTVLQFRRGTTTQNNNFTGSAGELSIDTTLDTLRVHDGSTAGGFSLTSNTASQTLTNKTLTSPVLNAATIGTSLVPASADGAALGSASAEFSDLFLADDSTIQLGNDQDVTLTHIPDTGIRVNSTRSIQFNDAAESIASNESRLVLTSNSVAFRMPTADGTSGQALVTDASGNLSFAAAGATISGDTSTNTDFLLYFASSTSGALTAVKQDSGFTYNPSTGSLTSATFIGALTGNASGSAATLATPRAIALTGAVTGTANFDGSAGISISTTATSDPTITLAGDLSGSATLTNLGDATLTATIAANSVALSTDTTGNYVAAGATSGSGISGSVSSEGGTFTVTSNATNANTGSTIVFRDGSGNFSAGTITATATTAQYADLAEKYTSDEDYEPGTVVELGGTHEVTQTTRPWSPTIAGIVSTDPAYLMNNDLDGVSVALIGRVPCKVVGPVRKGEFLVSSRTPGHAQAHKDLHGPPAGSAIGKAIEDKDSEGIGVIEVLVGRM